MLDQHPERHVHAGKSSEKYFRAEPVIAATGLKAGDFFLDIGCGIGEDAADLDDEEKKAGARFDGEVDPSLLADPAERRRPVGLHEEPPFCCIQCGKPFATRRVIDNILDKLTGHAMFASERARRRLQMCEDCRVVDAVQDAEAMGRDAGEELRKTAGDTFFAMLKSG